MMTTFFYLALFSSTCKKGEFVCVCLAFIKFYSTSEQSKKGIVNK